jgi:hypothetical protein
MNGRAITAALGWFLSGELFSGELPGDKGLWMLLEFSILRFSKGFT